MSNQIVISSGAKVRSLEGVLTGSAGIVNSVPLGGANGVATLDSNGKVPLSQLPASVVTYLGTWNAATNTPTLANGTGDVGDLYICNVAGTVNFGAGPITFAVGDWVIYNGSEWQKSSGASGTVTSVAVTESGDALNITGSPITTAGTINIGFAGNSTQYINGEGNLTTFPTLTGYVPYTGATTDVDLGVHVLNAQALHVKGTAGTGHLGLKHQSAAATGSANESLIYANVDGDLAWQNDNLYLTTLSTHANTANRVYTFPDANGTIALTSNLSSYVPYTGATSNVDLGSHNLTTTGDLFAGSVTGGGIFAETNVGGEGYIYLKGNGTFGILSIYNSIFANGYKYGFDVQGGTTGAAKRAYLDFGSLTNSTTRTYSFPDASGTVALTSDIPSLSGYVQGSGTTNYHAKFTAGFTIGNSMLTDDGTTLQSIGATRSNLYLKAASSSYYGQLAFTNGTNGSFGGLSYNNASQYMQFEVNSSEYMRLYGNGNLRLFTLSATDNGSKFQVEGAATFSNNIAIAGQTLSSWGGTFGVMQSYYGSYFGGTSTGGTVIGNNNYYNGTSYVYVNSDYATQYQQGSGEHFWRTAASGTAGGTITFTERMRITNSGNVGIGVTPSGWLSVDGYAALQVGNASLFGRNSANSELYLSSNAYDNSSGNPTYITTDFAARYIQNDGTHIWYSAPSGTAGNAITFTERMRITSDGKIGIGTTSPNAQAQVYLTYNSDTFNVRNTYASFSSTNIIGVVDRSASSTYDHLACISNNQYQFRVRGDGTLFAVNTTIQAISDIRTKENIINSIDGLNIISALRPVRFDYKEGFGNDRKNQLGFIAQEVEEVFPEAVDVWGKSDDKENPYKSVGTAALIPVLVKAIQEQQEIINNLSAKVTALENKL